MGRRSWGEDHGAKIMGRRPGRSTAGYYHRYLARASTWSHNVAVGFSLLFIGFLQKIAVGAATVFALLLIIWLGMPRRSAPVASRRRTMR